MTLELLALPPVPPTQACGWPVSYLDCSGECAAYEKWPEDQRAMAQAYFEAIAADMLWNWTGGVFGVCDVEVRPCRQDCAGAAAWGSTFWGRGPGFDPGFPRLGGGGGGAFYPVLVSGQWFNITCGCAGACRCDPSGPAVLALPGPIQSVTTVTIDGEVVPPSAYRVSNGRHLIRTDGGVWPRCQDMNKPGGPRYEPVVIQNPTNTITATRSGQVVQLLIEPTALFQGGNFAGNLPWLSKTGASATPRNSAGNQVGHFAINAGLPGITGSSGPGFLPFTVIYETADAPGPGDYSDTFVVDYQRGIPVPVGGQAAAGRLACELALAACDDDDCGLPERIQTITRQGLTVGVNTSDTAWEQTGIWSIDNWVTSVNRPKAFASVRSVDLPSLR